MVSHHSHKHTLFLCADGNFRLARKYKNEDIEDFSLSDGRSYFVEDEFYNKFLALKANDTVEGICI